MKRLRPMFKKLEGLFLKEVSTNELQEIKYLTEFEVSYYEAMLLRNQWPPTPRGFR